VVWSHQPAWLKLGRSITNRYSQHLGQAERIIRL